MDSPTGVTVVLDLDGTLVDSVPVHVLAWQAAFREVGVAVPSHHVQRAVGMGGDRLVAAVAGDAVEQSFGDRLRERHPVHVDRLFGEIAPTEGALELLETLGSTGHTLVLASSGGRELTDRLLDLVDGAAALLDRTVTGSDAEESKPAPHLVETALDSVDADRAVVVGDAVWDVRAAANAGVPCVGLLTGGIGAAELLDAGALDVHDTPRTLAEHVRATRSVLPDTRDEIR